MHSAIPLLIVYSFFFIAVVMLFFRGQYWFRTWRLGRAVRMTPEHLDHVPRKLKDLRVGEEAHIGIWNVSVSKKGRTYIDWDARLEEPPSFRPLLRVKRLKKGFSLIVNPGDTFSMSRLATFHGAPVIELLQATPEEARQTVVH